MIKYLLAASSIFLLTTSYGQTSTDTDRYASPMTIPGYNPPRDLTPPTNNAPNSEATADSSVNASSTTNGSSEGSTATTNTRSTSPSSMTNSPTANTTSPDTQLTTPAAQPSTNTPAASEPMRPTAPNNTTVIIPNNAPASNLMPTTGSNNTVTTNAMPMRFQCPPAGVVDKKLLPLENESVETVEMKSFGMENGKCHIYATMKFKPTVSDPSFKNKILTEECYFNANTVDAVQAASQTFNQEKAAGTISMATLNTLKNAMSNLLSECTITMDGKPLSLPFNK
jgi:hypothetical protein